MIRAALSDDSMKVTCRAPRDSASMPIAPDPAQTSAKRASSIRGARMLKSVSRKRSEVGRTLNGPAHRSAFTTQPPNFGPNETHENPEQINFPRGLRLALPKATYYR